MQNIMRLIALILFLLLLPFIIFLCLVILLFDGTPVLFTQERIGLNKRAFKIYKLRTMTDGKVSRVGRIFRKLGLDELPQLLNIIKGDMAFVGPRPLTESDIQRLGWDTSDYKSRWSVKPGITGSAQLLKVCDKELSIREDLKYVSKKNIFLDLKILLKSVLVPVFGKGVKK